MKKWSAIAVALVACLAFASVASAGKHGDAKSVHVRTNVKLNVPSHDASSTLRGKVRARKGNARTRRLCRANRKVNVPGAGKARTGSSGRFVIQLRDRSPAGTYRAEVRRKTIREGGEKTVCRRARSKKLTVRTLDRPAEPVVLTGDDLARMSGVAPDRVAAFRYEASRDRWEQIPVQVDERHVVDLRAVHNNTLAYSLESLEYSDPGTLTGPDPTPAIDPDDELVFMARDGFGRAPADAADPAGVRPGSGRAVRIADPLDPDATAWVYLFEHGGKLDPAAGRDYVDYDFDLLAGQYPEDYDFDGGPGNPIGDPPANPAPPANPESSRVATDFYSERFGDRWITDELRITAGSATGVDILDRNRLGAPFVTAVPTPCPRTENTFAAGHGAFVANIDGPVRAIRDYIGANSGLYTQRRHLFYERREDLVTVLRVHPLPIGPSDLLDYATAATGMTYRNDLMNAAVTIDGNPDSVPSGRLTWELATGRQGSLVVAHRTETDIPGFPLTSIYLDDSTPAQPPCTGDGEALATSGPSIQSGLPRTDPTPRGDPRGEGLPVHRLITYRTHFYEPPGVKPGAAARRSEEAGRPLVTRVVPRR
jgi:hypothetical protein